jgi:hypothetical protein
MSVPTMRNGPNAKCVFLFAFRVTSNATAKKPPTKKDAKSPTNIAS